MLISGTGPGTIAGAGLKNIPGRRDKETTMNDMQRKQTNREHEA